MKISHISSLMGACESSHKKIISQCVVEENFKKAIWIKMFGFMSLNFVLQHHVSLLNKCLYHLVTLLRNLPERKWLGLRPLPPMLFSKQILSFIWPKIWETFANLCLSSIKIQLILLIFWTMSPIFGDHKIEKKKPSLCGAEPTFKNESFLVGSWLNHKKKILSLDSHH
jgi:hypothetical protein